MFFDPSSVHGPTSSQLSETAWSHGPCRCTTSAGAWCTGRTHFFHIQPTPTTGTDRFAYLSDIFCISFGHLLVGFGIWGVSGFDNHVLASCYVIHICMLFFRWGSIPPPPGSRRPSGRTGLHIFRTSFAYLLDIFWWVWGFGVFLVMMILHTVFRCFYIF